MGRITHNSQFVHLFILFIGERTPNHGIFMPCRGLEDPSESERVWGGLRTQHIIKQQNGSFTQSTCLSVIAVDTEQPISPPTWSGFTWSVNRTVNPTTIQQLDALLRCKGTTKLHLRQRVFQRMLTNHIDIIDWYNKTTAAICFTRSYSCCRYNV